MRIKDVMSIVRSGEISSSIYYLVKVYDLLFVQLHFAGTRWSAITTIKRIR